MTARVARTLAVPAAVAVALVVLHLLGIDVAGWFEDLFDALTEVDPEYIALGLVFQTLDGLLSGLAWLAILRYAYPDAGIRALPILTAYAVAVAGNDVLPASLGTLVMLVMLATLVPGATFPGLVGGQVVHKLFFVAAGTFVYLYLFLSVPGSFSAELSLLEEHRGLAVLIPALVVVGTTLAIRAFWHKLRGLWKDAKQGGAILGQPRAFGLKVVLPELGSWLCKLAVIAVFMAAYGIPVTLHTVMSVAGGNSLANVVSVTPGGAGVNQAVNSATLTREDVDRETALAYSTGQQLITTAWSVTVAVALVTIVFGWSGGKSLVASSYREAKARAPSRTSRREDRRDEES